MSNKKTKQPKAIYLTSSEFPEVFRFMEQAKTTFSIKASSRQLAAALIIEGAQARLQDTSTLAAGQRN